MGKLFKLDRSGHGEVVTWGEDAQSREAGAEAFKSLTERGFTMFDITDPENGKKLEAFAPEAAEIIAVPRLVAG